ncbi:MAG: polymerase sigma factor FliA [Chloroflexota bacterium]|jgi:RNA polymerase sigma factor for flagellar operon FliA|nr:polymerase sigma factor FliA [Chloroflexota bacterium]
MSALKVAEPEAREEAPELHTITQGSVPARQGNARNDPELRDKLIVQYAPLVKYVVGRLAISLPPSVSPEDLVGYGTIGLIQAVDRFDPTVGVKFETYAIQRIRGSILDAMRSLQPLSRGTIRRAREVERAYEELTHRLGRTPEEQEVADHIGLTIPELHKQMVEATARTVSLDSPLGDSGDDEGEPFSLSDHIADSALGVGDLVERADLHRVLAEAVRCLSEREQLVLSLYYVDELTLKELSAILGVSTSRVCQIHAAAILKLRGMMRASQQTTNLDDEAAKPPARSSAARRR